MTSGIMAELRAAAHQAALELRPTDPPPIEPAPCAGYRIPLTCIACGNPIEPRTGSTSNGREARAVADCSRCGEIHLVAVTVSTQPGKRRPVATPRKPPVKRNTDADIDHGTPEGYDQHRGISPPCDPCKNARNAKVRTDRAATKGRPR